MKAFLVQYTFELRELPLCHSKSLLSYMVDCIANHVFREKGREPIESGYSINYYVSQKQFDELCKASQAELDEFLRRLDFEKRVHKSTNIFVYLKSNIKQPAGSIMRKEKSTFFLTSSKGNELKCC